MDYRSNWSELFNTPEIPQCVSPPWEQIQYNILLSPGCGKYRKSGERSLSQQITAKSDYEKAIEQAISSSKNPVLIIATDGSTISGGATGAGLVVFDVHMNRNIHSEEFPISKHGTPSMGEICGFLKALEFIHKKKLFVDRNLIFFVDYYMIIGNLCGDMSGPEYNSLYAAINYYLEIINPENSNRKIIFCWAP